MDSAREMEPFPQWFAEYRRLGGEHTKEEFAKNLDVFHEITMGPYVMGDLEKPDGTHWESRDEAFEFWASKIGSWEEAMRYFQAVDNITAYS